LNWGFKILYLLWLIGQNVPYVFFVFIAMFYQIYKFQKDVMPTQRQTRKLVNQSSLPVVAVTQSRFTGGTVIRAFGKEKYFEGRFLEKCHQAILSSQINDFVHSK
jgi:hypothetical protein